MNITFQPDSVVIQRTDILAQASSALTHGTEQLEQIILTPYGLRWCNVGQIQGTFIAWADIGGAEAMPPEVSLVARDGRFLAAWWTGYGPRDGERLASIVNGFVTRFREVPARTARLDPRIEFLRMDVARADGG